MIEAGRKVGFDPSGTSKFATQMAAAGFINIQETIYKWPLNSWPKGKKDKLLGRWGNADFSEAFKDSLWRFSRGYWAGHSKKSSFSSSKLGKIFVTRANIPMSNCEC